VWQLNAGGIAIWLMNVLRHIGRQRCRMDFRTADSPASPRFAGRALCGLGSSRRIITLNAIEL
jgi:hypothetical protein